MISHFIDWLIITLCLLIISGTGFYMSRRASRHTGDFSLTGRNLRWYIAGTSMIDTTFATDTPPAVTKLVADNEKAGNRHSWNMLTGILVLTVNTVINSKMT